MGLCQSREKKAIPAAALVVEKATAVAAPSIEITDASPLHTGTEMEVKIQDSSVAPSSHSTTAPLVSHFLLYL